MPVGSARQSSGRRCGSADLEMLGLALEGSALVASADVRTGLTRLDEATVTALEGNAEIPISGAWTCCFLVSACTSLRDHERAYDWCDRIAAFAERYGSRYMLAFCRSEYGLVAMWRGDWEAAEAQLVAAVEDFRASRPAWIAAPLVTLAELRRRQGRHAEAAALLERVGAGPAAAVCRAWLALDTHDARRAAELAQRALRHGPPRRLARLPVLELLVRARLGRDELDEAAAAAREIAEVGELAGTTAVRGAAALAAGRGRSRSRRARDRARGARRRRRRTSMRPGRRTTRRERGSSSGPACWRPVDATRRRPSSPVPRRCFAALVPRPIGCERSRCSMRLGSRLRRG